MGGEATRGFPPNRENGKKKNSLQNTAYLLQGILEYRYAKIQGKHRKKYFLYTGWCIYTIIYHILDCWIQITMFKYIQS